MNLTIDFETRSQVQIRTAGVYNYASDPSTEIMCLAIKEDDNNTVVWIPPPFRHLARCKHIPGNILAGLISRAQRIEAHNAGFELQIWENIMVKWGFKPLDINKVFCSAAKAAASALPRDLNSACEAVQSNVSKSSEGHTLMLSMCKPRKPSARDRRVSGWRDKIYWKEGIKDFNDLVKYCLQDVEAEYALSLKLPELNKKERELWLLDYKINSTGIYTDLKSIGIIQAKLKEYEKLLSLKVRRLTRGEIVSVRQVAKTLSWIGDRGLKLPNLQALTVEGALRGELESGVRELLEIRVKLNKSSTAKYQRIQDWAGKDQRVRGMFMYHGASTGRWSGKGPQTHNLPRGDLGILAENALEDFSLVPEELFRLSYGDYFNAAAACVRSTFCAPEGKKFLCADYASIEARVLAWLAGEEDILDVFRSGKDLYKITAGTLFDVTYDEVSTAQRAIGKVTTLALGYAGGIGAFSAMGRVYGLSLSDMYRLVINKVSPKQLIDAKKLAKMYLKTHKDAELTEREAIGCDLIKQLWREGRHKVTTFWREVEGAAVDAVLTKKVQKVGKILFGVTGSFLLCKLPSDRNLYYPFPMVETKQTPWGLKDRCLSYMSPDNASRKWLRKESYGGLVVENITQAIARDALAESLILLDTMGYTTVMHVHDEVLAEEDMDSSLETFLQIVSTPPSWALDLPIAASGWEGKRYRK